MAETAEATRPPESSSKGAYSSVRNFLMAACVSRGRST